MLSEYGDHTPSTGRDGQSPYRGSYGVAAAFKTRRSPLMRHGRTQPMTMLPQRLPKFSVGGYLRAVDRCLSEGALRCKACGMTSISLCSGTTGSPGRISSTGAGAMGDTALSDRQIKLLAVVAEGGGDWDARRIDLTANARYGPGEGTVLQELEVLQRLGLVVRDDTRSGVGGRWKVTAAARPDVQ